MSKVSMRLCMISVICLLILWHAPMIEAFIQDGGFEVLYWWGAEGNSSEFFLSSEDVHSGTWCARVDSPSGSDPNILYQQISIPAGTIIAELELFDKTLNDTGPEGEYQITIRDTNMNLWAVLFGEYTPHSWDWTHRYFDLTSYKGQTFRLCFEEISGDHCQVDDVTLTLDLSTQIIYRPGLENNWDVQDGFPVIQLAEVFTDDLAANVADVNHGPSIPSPILYQIFTVPDYGSGGTKISLWDKGTNSSNASLDPVPSYRIFLASSDGSVELETLYLNDTLGDTWDWTKREFDVESYEGQTIRICFEKTQEFGVFIDEVYTLSSVPSLSIAGMFFVIIVLSGVILVSTRR